MNNKLSDNISGKGEFCCERMHREIFFFEQKLLDAYDMPKSYIWYRRPNRKYLLFRYPGDWGDISGGPIDYCPYCGVKLPKSFEDEDMDEILRKEYGWTDDDCWGYPRRELPPEFKTDEWWKKRGL